MQLNSDDSEAAMLVRCTTDDFMTLLLQELQVAHLLSTPTGMVYQLRKGEQIDEMHTQKIKQIKESREQKKIETSSPKPAVAPAPTQPVPVPVGKIAGRGMFLVDCQSGQNIKLEGYNIKDLVYLKHNNNSVFDMDGKCTKLIVGKSNKSPLTRVSFGRLTVVAERCDNLVLNIKGGVLTSTLEVINCTNVVLNVFVPIFTMQVDNSTSVNVTFSTLITGLYEPHKNRYFNAYLLKDSEKLLKNIVWNCTNELYIEVKDDTGGLKYAIDTGVDIIQTQFPEMDLKPVQFITHFVDGQLETEMVIREGAGYATTAREKKIMDDKLEKDIKIMQEFLNKLIQVSVRDKKQQEKEEKEV